MVKVGVLSNLKSHRFYKISVCWFKEMSTIPQNFKMDKMALVSRIFGYKSFCRNKCFKYSIFAKWLLLCIYNWTLFFGEKSQKGGLSRHVSAILLGIFFQKFRFFLFSKIFLPILIGKIFPNIFNFSLFWKFLGAKKKSKLWSRKDVRAFIHRKRSYYFF